MTWDGKGRDKRSRVYRNRWYGRDGNLRATGRGLLQKKMKKTKWGQKS